MEQGAYMEPVAQPGAKCLDGAMVLEGAGA